MTRQEFVEEYAHEFMGMLLDIALDQRQGAELSRQLKLKGMRVREKLASIYATLCPHEVVKEFHGEEKPKPQLKVR